MSSKCKKGKKKANKLNHVVRVKDAPANKKIHAYFTNDEIAEVKKLLKIKDVTQLPPVVAATVLYKFDLLDILLKDGCDIDQAGQNNMTALMWAVRHKFLDVIDFLLANGADPTIKTDSGDNVPMAALENKLWDESSFVKLWTSMKAISQVDVNFTNKSGHSMLHMCVRRDWEAVLKILLDEKPNVDSANSNGVTPLMLACFRSNLNMIDALIGTGSDILKEDHHGRTPLCYAISVHRNGGQSSAADRIVAELEEKQTFDVYINRRLQLTSAVASKGKMSPATAEIFIKTIRLVVQNTKEGLRILLQCKIFEELCKNLAGNNCPDIVKFLLEFCNEVLFYDESSFAFDLHLKIQIGEDFLRSGFGDLCLDIIKSKMCLKASCAAFKTLVLANPPTDQLWTKRLQENCALLSYCLENFENHLTQVEDDIRAKTLKKQAQHMREILDSQEISPATAAMKELLHDNQDQKEKTEHPSTSKKSKRRAKALKAKVTKIKSAEFSRRRILTSKKAIHQQKSPKPNITSLTGDAFEKSNPIVSNLKHLLAYSTPKWKERISASHFVDPPRPNLETDLNGLTEAIACMKNSTNKTDTDVKSSLVVIFDYLKSLVMFIVQKYEEHWEEDRSSRTCTCDNVNEHVPWLFGRHLEKMKVCEKNLITALQNDFDNLFLALEELSRKNLTECLNNMNKLEDLLLNYRIRGVKTMCYRTNVATFRSKYRMKLKKNISDGQANNLVMKYMEDVLNEVHVEQQDINIEIYEDVEDANESNRDHNTNNSDVIYLSRQPVKDPKKHIDAKANTIQHSYHLEQSIMNLCDEDSTGPEQDFHIGKRLQSQISNLRNAKNHQKFLTGKIRLCDKQHRRSYVISAGINFTAVELGLDLQDQPLAVKRIPRASCVAKILRNSVKPLLGLTNDNLLHYFACDYDENELILASPLCQFNLLQYVQVRRKSDAISGLTAVEVMKQFLNGLMVLHEWEAPVVHGNLKPSNIFIDFNGTVKVAEFGIHKALYRIIEVPNSSLMWFAKESLVEYKISSILECTTLSDVYVAGMLICFILSYGSHPFGDDADEIIRNIQNNITKCNLRNSDLKDLFTWMTAQDIHSRPAIKDVLLHPLFWPASKKWQLVLVCSGANQKDNAKSLNLEHLYKDVRFVWTRCDWHEKIHSRFPNLPKTGSNTIVGLLKAIRYCYEQPGDFLNLPELSAVILTTFPNLCVSLYRGIIRTHWIEQEILKPFTVVGTFTF